MKLSIHILFKCISSEIWHQVEWLKVYNYTVSSSSLLGNPTSAHVITRTQKIRFVRVWIFCFVILTIWKQICSSCHILPGERRMHYGHPHSYAKNLLQAPDWRLLFQARWANLVLGRLLQNHYRKLKTTLNSVKFYKTKALLSTYKQKSSQQLLIKLLLLYLILLSYICRAFYLHE